MSRSVVVRLMLLSALMLPAQSVSAQYVAGNIGSMPGSTEQRLADALNSIGMTRCTSRAVQVGRFLMEGSHANFTVQPLGPNGDLWPTVITMESSHADNGTTRLSIISISPNCAGFYQQTIYWSQPCSVLRSGTFAAFTGAQRLLANVIVSELDVATQLYLMPAGPQGCVSVKKELFR
ncbi:MAG: hypothetical protein DCF28_01590 [Alphaproteobacteria bacterium]|nr:MAG: hypothetical protein DCF28_01590 [Alphaproteobacteria bacterium]